MTVDPQVADMASWTVYIGQMTAVGILFWWLVSAVLRIRRERRVRLWLIALREALYAAVPAALALWAMAMPYAVYYATAGDPGYYQPIIDNGIRTVIVTFCALVAAAALFGVGGALVLRHFDDRRAFRAAPAS